MFSFNLIPGKRSPSSSKTSDPFYAIKLNTNKFSPFLEQHSIFNTFISKLFSQDFVSKEKKGPIFKLLQMYSASAMTQIQLFIFFLSFSTPRRHDIQFESTSYKFPYYFFSAHLNVGNIQIEIAKRIASATTNNVLTQS